MGERKVQNYYYPPNFDPAKLPRRKQPKNLQSNVRNMLAMRIQCKTCGNYIAEGTKVNSRREVAVGETYLGIKILRFYFKCTHCSAELTMKTDPQNGDYIMESGATRQNIERWQATDEAVAAAKAKREAEETGDAMKALENKTFDSKQEMDIMAALDELKSLRERHARVTTAEMLEALNKAREEKQRDDRSVVFQNSSHLVRQIDDAELDDDMEDSFYSGGVRATSEKEAKPGEPLRRKMGNRQTRSQEAVNSFVEHIQETGDKGNQLKRKADPVKAPFAVRPKPVKLIVKPKASSSTATERKLVRGSFGHKFVFSNRTILKETTQEG